MKIYLSIFTSLLLLLRLNVTFCQIAVLAGGALDPNNTEVYGTFINLSTPTNSSPYIGVISAGSDDSTGTGQEMVQLFQETYGVKKVEWIPINLTLKYEAENPLIAYKVSQMTGIFFAGGDQ